MNIIPLAVTIWLMVCAYFDWCNREVGNWLTLPVLVLSAIWAIINWDKVLLLWLITFAIMLWLWKKGGTGGADIRILVSLSSLWPMGLIFSALANAITSLVVIKVKGRGAVYPAVVPIAIGAIIALIIEKMLSIA